MGIIKWVEKFIDELELDNKVVRVSKFIFRHNSTYDLVFALVYLVQNLIFVLAIYWKKNDSSLISLFITLYVLFLGSTKAIEKIGDNAIKKEYREISMRRQYQDVVDGVPISPSYKDMVKKLNEYRNKFKD